MKASLFHINELVEKLPTIKDPYCYCLNEGTWGYYREIYCYCLNEGTWVYYREIYCYCLNEMTLQYNPILKIFFNLFLLFIC